jgi:hypothetical protein
MRVQAIRTFYDRKAEYWRKRGDVFDASDERAEYLISLGMVKKVEQPKAQTKRTTRKRTTKE